MKEQALDAELLWSWGHTNRCIAVVKNNFSVPLLVEDISIAWECDDSSYHLLVLPVPQTILLPPNSPLIKLELALKISLNRNPVAADTDALQSKSVRIKGRECIPYSVSSCTILRIIIFHTPYHHIPYSVSSYPILRIIIFHTPNHHIPYSVSSYLILRIIIFHTLHYILIQFLFIRT